MNLKLDQQTGWLVGGVLALLVVSSIAGGVLSKTVQTDQGRATSGVGLPLPSFWYARA